MQLKKWMQVVLVSSSIVMLAACSSGKKNNSSAVNGANSAAAYNGEAQASGLGEESRFGEQGGAGSEQTLSKRVYYFDLDSNVVRADDKPAIDANADYLIAHPNARVMLEGHTDPRGSREYNIGLGERRARAVAEILTEKGVNPAQIRIVSYGAEKRVGMGSSAADFQLDRRVVLVYLKR
jgi:peptidoglycan-associated lipoprotein